MHSLDIGQIGPGVSAFKAWYFNRTGMPPASSFVEIMILQADRILGTQLLEAFLRWGYHLLAATYWWVVFYLLSARMGESWIRWILLFLSGLRYLGTTKIFLGNPQIYDLQYGLVLIWITFELIFGRSHFRLMLPLFLFAFLRPFGFVVLLLTIVLLVFQKFRKHESSRRVLVATTCVFGFFVLLRLPHTIVTGQFSWSNHTGFNLMHVWWPIVKEHPVSEREDTWEDQRGVIRQNLNTEVHFRNSERMKSAIFGGIAKNPLGALGILKDRLLVAFDFPVTIYQYTPEGVDVAAVIWIWRAGLFVLALFAISALLGKMKGGANTIPLELSSFYVFAIVVVTVVGDEGEEARLLVPLLGPILIVIVEVFNNLFMSDFRGDNTLN